MTIQRTHHHDGTAGTDASSTGEGYDEAFGTVPKYAAGGFKNQCLEYSTTAFGYFQDDLAYEYCGGYLRLPVAPTANCNFAVIKNAGGTNLGYLTIDTEGTLSIRNSGARDDTSALTLTTGQWYRWEWHPAASAGTQELRIFDPATGDTAAETLTGGLPTDTVAALAFGQLSNSGVRFQLDEVVIADDWPNLGAPTTGRFVRRVWTGTEWV